MNNRDKVSQDELSAAYEEGLHAAECGEIAATCPYDFCSSLGSEWLQGFQDGGGED